MAGETSCEAGTDGCKVTPQGWLWESEGKLFLLSPCVCSLVYSLLAVLPSTQFFWGVGMLRTELKVLGMLGKSSTTA